MSTPSAFSSASGIIVGFRHTGGHLPPPDLCAYLDTTDEPRCWGFGGHGGIAIADHNVKRFSLEQYWDSFPGLGTPEDTSGSWEIWWAPTASILSRILKAKPSRLHQRPMTHRTEGPELAMRLLKNLQSQTTITEEWMTQVSKIWR